MEQWGGTHTHTLKVQHISTTEKKLRIFDNILTSETLFRRKFAANNKNYEERNFNQLEKNKENKKTNQAKWGKR